MADLRVVAVIPGKPEAADQVREALTTLVMATREEAGCVSYDLSESAATPGTFVTVEVWTSTCRPRTSRPPSPRSATRWPHPWRSTRWSRWPDVVAGNSPRRPALNTVGNAPEQAVDGPGCCYLLFPDGAGRSRMPGPRGVATARNWRTVLALQALLTT